MVLGARAPGLDGAEQGRQPARVLPIPSSHNTVGKASPERVAAAGGIHDFFGPRGRNGFVVPGQMDHGSLRARGDDQGVRLRTDSLVVPARGAHQHFRFVAVHRNPVGHADEFAQFRAAELSKPLAGIEQERDSGIAHLRRVVQHGLAAVRRNQTQLRFGFRRQPLAVGLVHGAGVEGGDLVIVQIGNDVGLRGELIGQFADQRRVQSQLLDAAAVASEIAACGGQHQGPFAQQRQVVGDIAGAAAEFPPQLGNVEGYIEDMYLVREYALAEAAAKQHDAVVGERTAYDGGAGPGHGAGGPVT